MAATALRHFELRDEFIALFTKESVGRRRNRCNVPNFERFTRCSVSPLIFSFSILTTAAASGPEGGSSRNPGRES
jgi:hypothetical protein